MCLCGSSNVDTNVDAARLEARATMHRAEHGVGIVTAVGNAMGPFIEYFSENLSERSMGAFGIGLIFIGFSLQSLDVPVR
jgi:hypothetical protein